MMYVGYCAYILVLTINFDKVVARLSLLCDNVMTTLLQPNNDFVS